jgi:carbonic anhydrase
MVKFRYLLVALLSVLLFNCSPSIKRVEAFPEDPLQRLKVGNDRFKSDKALHPHLTHKRLSEIADKQRPFAVIVSCSDSRVPPELIFDQGLGDLFVIRTAGNTLSELEIGSMEYAVEHLNVKTIVVMGHEDCGALKAVADNTLEKGNLGTLIDHLKEEPELKVLHDSNPSVNTLVVANIHHAVLQIKDLPGVLHEKSKKGELIVIAAKYSLHDGSVIFF